MRRGRAADHSPPSSAAVMEEKSYTSTHPLDHTGPVTESLYVFYKAYIILSDDRNKQGIDKNIRDDVT